MFRPISKSRNNVNNFEKKRTNFSLFLVLSEAKYLGSKIRGKLPNEFSTLIQAILLSLQE